MKRKDLIRQMAIARHTHVDWASYQRKRRSEGKPAIKNVGGETFHREWVKVYDEVLKTLRKGI